MMRGVLGLAGFALAVAVVWMLTAPAPGVSQPVAFSHAKHAGMGCAVCHDGVATRARAGLPPGAVCLACHVTAPRGASAAVWERLARGAPAPWVAVARVPDDVLFSHRRHVGLAQLACAACHGEVGRSTTPPRTPAVRLDMAACVGCHQQEGASEDCLACHR